MTLPVTTMNASGSALAPPLRVRLGCEFVYTTTPGSTFIARIEPQPSDRQRQIQSRRRVRPHLPVHRYRDDFGNRSWRLTSDSAAVAFSYDAVYAVPDAADETAASANEIPVAGLADEILGFTLASRYAQSDILSSTAWELFGTAAPGYPRVQAICDWVHANISYSAGSSDPSTSAVDTLTSRHGVCRDFAHLPIAFCRALNIPARYAFGYLPDFEVVPDPSPMDFHAWFEAYLEGPRGGTWYTFDARHNRPRKGRVKVAHGRDAIDVAMVTSYGTARLDSMTVWCEATRGQA
jgi:transglutaminase-like putative cysteine protease